MLALQLLPDCFRDRVSSSPQLAWNLQCRSGWPRSRRDSPTSASWLLGSQACATTPGSCLTRFFKEWIWNQRAPVSPDFFLNCDAEPGLTHFSSINLGNCKLESTLIRQSCPFIHKPKTFHTHNVKHSSQCSLFSVKIQIWMSYVQCLDCKFSGTSTFIHYVSWMTNWSPKGSRSHT